MLLDSAAQQRGRDFSSGEQTALAAATASAGELLKSRKRSVEARPRDNPAAHQPLRLGIPHGRSVVPAAGHRHQPGGCRAAFRRRHLTADREAGAPVPVE